MSTTTTLGSFSRSLKRPDSSFPLLCLLCALLSAGLLGALLLQMAASSLEAWKAFGAGFLFSSQWNPATDQYGARVPLTGTLLTTLIALLLAVPPAFAAANYLLDAPKGVASILGNAIDLLAAIPSVIYGMWGLFVLAPALQQYVQPFLAETLGLGRFSLFGAEYNGFGLLTAGLILSLMVLPFLCATMRDVLKMTPPVLREAAYGMGCTKWEVTRDVVIPYGLQGLLGSVFLGLGRALGETMAVLFVIGNMMELPRGLFGSTTTIAATLANNFAEAEGLQRSALFALGVTLLAISLLIQVAVQLLLRKPAAEKR